MTKTIKLNVSQTVVAPLDKVWEIVSNVDNDTRYYRGMSEIKNISKEGNKIERELTVGFFKHKARQTIVLKPKTIVEAVMTEGPMEGTRTTALTPVDKSNTKIEVVWNVIPSGIPSFVHGRVEKELAEGTKQALQKIASELAQQNGTQAEAAAQNSTP
jgi:carbon monoxide dehydrogenase subunit G